MSTADIVFEASFEVCNKVGGIYTVVASKLPVMKTYFDTYYSIGPLFDNLPEKFLESRPPSEFQDIFNELSQEGIKCVFGTWDEPGKPDTILIDGRALMADQDNLKTLLWEKYKVDSYGSGYDFVEPMCWSWSVGKFVEKVKDRHPDKKIISHFHEWLSGFGVLYLDYVGKSEGTVFTTHATMLGRAAASRGWSLCSGERFDPESKAKEVGVSNKWSTERACAHAARAFTTVSDLTGEEAEFVLEKKPFITPNGLALQYFPTFEDIMYKHARNKKLLQRNTISHFFLQQPFDLNNTYFFSYGGRYEYKNKGLDIIVDDLARLNQKLKEEQSEKTIVMFFFIAMPGGEPEKQLLENKIHVSGLLNDLREKTDAILHQLLLSIVSDTDLVKLLPEEDIKRKRDEFNFIRKDGNPLLATHQFGNMDQDPLLNHLKEVGLTNNKEDRVKVVMVPRYLDGKDGLFNMTYYDALSGCDLSVFPSFYEPWGYTPLESVAFGVPTVTSNTAGFGVYMKPKIIKENAGLFVIDRCTNDDVARDQLYDIFSRFIALSDNERVNTKMHAHALSSFCDWRQLIKHYIEAYKSALE